MLYSPMHQLCYKTNILFRSFRPIRHKAFCRVLHPYPFEHWYRRRTCFRYRYWKQKRYHFLSRPSVTPFFWNLPPTRYLFKILNFRLPCARLYQTVFIKNKLCETNSGCGIHKKIKWLLLFKYQKTSIRIFDDRYIVLFSVWWKLATRGGSSSNLSNTIWVTSDITATIFQRILLL